MIARKQRMKKVLIITYYWPPAGGPGVQRWLKFARYLPDNGWEPVILTVRDGSYPAVDESLLRDVPEGLEVYKTKAGGPFRWYNALKGKKGNNVSVALIRKEKRAGRFDRLAVWIRSNLFIPDARKGWKRYALREIPKILAEHNCLAIITTGPPHSTHLIGLKVAAQTGLPWIADFRDPWTTVYYNTMMPRTRLAEWMDKLLENRVLANADAVLTVGEGMKQEFMGRAKRVEVFTNGFDRADMFSGLKTHATDQFLMLHTGNLASNQQASGLWMALAAISAEDPGFARALKIQMVGNTDGAVLERIAECGLQDYLEVVAYVPHLEATRRMAEASVLILIIPDAPGSKSILTGKLFEYIGSGTPVVGIGPPDGDAAAILSEAERGVMFDFPDSDGVKGYIRKLYAEWKQNGKVSPKGGTEKAEKFSRQTGAANLSALLDEMTSRG